MKTQKSIALLLIALLLPFAVAFYASAQVSDAQSSAVVPRLVNFSGKAVDAQGKAISGIAGVTLSIYKEQSGGAPLWMETQNVQADAKGSYILQLGSTKPEGLPLDLFLSGEARWLGVRINGDAEQPRVLLLSVPYALKAADAETLGGKPASAYALAATSLSNPAAGSSASMSAGTTMLDLTTVPSPQAAVTGTGSANFVPLWTTASALGSSTLFQSGSGATAKLGLNTITPSSTLDVNGAGTIRGALSLPATAAATATAGTNSQPLSLAASSFSSSSSAAVSEFFNWQAESAGNDTASPTATLNLLFGSGTGKATETGLHIAKSGVITFATAQTFPAKGSGTVTSVGLTAPSSDFTVGGSPVTKSGTLALNWSVAPTSADTANAIVKRDSTGSFSAGSIASTLGSGTAISGATGSGIGVYGQSSGTGSGNNGVEGDSTAQAGSGVAGFNGANGIGVYGQGGTGVVGTGSTGVFGTGTSYGFATDSNAQQARSAGGWAKALVGVNGGSAPYKILRCYNSTLAGSAATTPPCGFNLTEVSYAVFDIDFGFEVDDRFWSVSNEGYVLHGNPENISATAFADTNGAGNTSLQVQLITGGGDPQGTNFTVVLF
jgi:hypothetical protein